MVRMSPPTLPPLERLTLLTTREREILGLLGCAMSDKEIRRLAHISEPTIRSHIRKITMKLGVRGRTHLALIAVWRGLAPPPASR